MISTVCKFAGVWLAAACVVGAQAKTYPLELSGSIEHAEADCQDFPDLCNPSSPAFTPEFRQWSGVATLVVNSPADGTYTGDGIVSFSLSSNIGPLTDFSASSSDLANALDGNLRPSPDKVSIANGSVASFDLTMFTPFQGIRFSGLDVTFISYAQRPPGQIDDFGVATLVSVPEPETFALMLLGVGALSYGRRRGHIVFQ